MASAISYHIRAAFINPTEIGRIVEFLMLYYVKEEFLINCSRALCFSEELKFQFKCNMRRFLEEIVFSYPGFVYICQTESQKAIVGYIAVLPKHYLDGLSNFRNSMLAICLYMNLCSHLTLFVGTCPQLYTNNLCQLGFLAIHPSHRRRRLGAHLVKEAVKFIEPNIDRSVYVFVVSPVLVQFMRFAGFRTVLQKDIGDFADYFGQPIYPHIPQMTTVHIMKYYFDSTFCIGAIIS